jgi:hypothetical protein
VLIYGSGARTIKNADEKRSLVYEMKFMRNARCALLHHKRNENILEGLKIQSVYGIA